MELPVEIPVEMEVIDMVGHQVLVDEGNLEVGMNQRNERYEEEQRELSKFIKDQRTVSTEKKNQQVRRRFQAWILENMGESTPIQDLEPGRLDVLMGSFFVRATIESGRRKGEQYEPDSLTAIHRALDRYLRDVGYPHNILRDPAFANSRDVLASKKKCLKKEGRGNRPNKAEALSDEELDSLFVLGLLGKGTPEALLHAVFVFFVMGFGMRPNHGSRQLCLGDVDLLEEEDKRTGRTVKYLQWNERLTKTRSGQLSDGVRAFPPKIYEVGGDRCPIELYNLYISKRPAAMMNAEDPFYLGINRHATSDSATWYICAPLGINKIQAIVSEMCTAAGFQGHRSNHSLRRTMCTNLLAQNVPPTLVAQVSGHKSVASLNHYAVASRPQQRAMSNIIVGNARPAERVQQGALPEEVRHPTPPVALPPTDPGVTEAPVDTGDGEGLDHLSDRTRMVRMLLNDNDIQDIMVLLNVGSEREVMDIAYPERKSAVAKKRRSLSLPKPHKCPKPAALGAASNEATHNVGTVQSGGPSQEVSEGVMVPQEVAASTADTAQSTVMPSRFGLDGLRSLLAGANVTGGINIHINNYNNTNDARQVNVQPPSSQ